MSRVVKTTLINLLLLAPLVCASSSHNSGLGAASLQRREGISRRGIWFPGGSCNEEWQRYISAAEGQAKGVATEVLAEAETNTDDSFVKWFNERFGGCGDVCRELMINALRDLKEGKANLDISCTHDCTAQEPDPLDDPNRPERLLPPHPIVKWETGADKSTATLCNDFGLRSDAYCAEGGRWVYLMQLSLGAVLAQAKVPDGDPRVTEQARLNMVDQARQLVCPSVGEHT